VHRLGDYYPAGDEYDLVHEVTGRLIPPAGIPIQVGVVVNNVETLANIANAANGRPVTHKMLTLAGAVKHPVTVTVPIGTTFRDAIEATGGFATDDPVLCIGGLMMGETTENLDAPITKTTKGVVVLPRTHHVIQRKLAPAKAQAAIGKSACDQCRYCTELCPRFLLGYAVEPHQVMRTLAFTASGKELFSQWAALCCACGLCTLYACPEDLYPKEACDQSKVERREAGLKFTQAKPPEVHPMKEYRRVPQAMLRKRLKIEEYDVETPFAAGEPKAATVRIKLRQHVGKPASPCIAEGRKVKRGQTIARVPETELGAAIHASIDGKVRAVTRDYIEIVA